MDNSELLQYRRKLIQDAMQFRKGDRVPHISNFVFWPILNAGYKLSEACRDWDIMEKCQRSFMDEFAFDQVRPIAGTLCNPPAMIDNIGEGFNIFDDANGTVSIRDMRLLMADEYDAFIADKGRYEWETILPRKYPRWNKLTVGDLVQPLEEFNKFNRHMAKMTDVARLEYGIPKISAMMGGMPGIEQLFCTYVGMRGMSSDLRRYPDKIKLACEVMERNTDAVIKQIGDTNLDESGSAFTIMISLLSHVFLNPKQWETFYWPRLKRILDAVVAANKTAYIFVEGKIDRFYSYFEDFPAGHIALHLEQDDLYEARRRLPNICLIGGMSTVLLGGGTPDECVAGAKKLIDELGTHGGFILSQDKMISYLRDAKPENVKAVCDFVQNYHI